MPTASTLLALAARCEREEPSRELDGNICAAIGHKISTDGWLIVPSFMEEGQEELRPPTPFTSSIDSAMTLVPEGWVLTLNTFQNGASVYVMNAAGDIVRPQKQYIATPALALCAAALKVRAAIAEQIEASPRASKGTPNLPSDTVGEER
jgi:hypothetical protein